MRTPFSRVFPATHPQRGQPTLFVEKILLSYGLQILGETFYEPMDFLSLNPDKEYKLVSEFDQSLLHYWRLNCKMQPKKHTIRAGKKAKAGDVFIPFVWTGRPYNSPTIIFNHPMKIARVVDFEMDKMQRIFLDGSKEPTLHGLEIAKNDGLDLEQFLEWFGTKGFSGQIRIWDDTDLLY